MTYLDAAEKAHIAATQASQVVGLAEDTGVAKLGEAVRALSEAMAELAESLHRAG